MDDERVTGGGSLERVPAGSPEMANTAPAEEGPEAAREAAAEHANTADTHVGEAEPMPDVDVHQAEPASDTTTEG